ncbi:MAG: hypothetical protein GY875_16360 [Gammaproteobacteria bacterium]|nr:hypothetical protein [Gammaproteobacteria bacterium]
MFSVDASARLNAKLTGLFRFSSVFGLSVPDNRCELLIIDALSSSPDSVTINASAPNTRPVAKAGPDQTGILGDTIVLDASASLDADGDTLSYSWTLVVAPGSSNAMLNGPASVMPSFTADVAGFYETELTVNDGQANSDPDRVVVNIDTLNTIPVADAGPDQGVTTGQPVQLNGTNSSDVDGDALSWSWSFVTTPPGSAAQLNNASAVSPTFTPDLTGQYVIQLLVNDGAANSLADSVIVNAITPNTIPLANAGVDQSDLVGALISLDGSASSDVDNDPLTYDWSLLSVPSSSAATLNNTTIVNPIFTLDQPGEYVAQLIVNDGSASSVPDEVIVSTLNSRPVAVAGGNQTVLIGDLVSLSGSGSYDADNDLLTWQWALIGQPLGGAATLSGETTIAPSFTPDGIGFYVIQLIASDSSLDSVPSSVTIQVNPLNDIEISVITPVENLFTNQIGLNFTGSISHTGELTINGSPVVIESDLSFDHPVTLTEGVNLFNLAATDAVDTQDALARSVTLDTVVPSAPLSGFIIVSLPNASNLVTITGQAGSVEPFSWIIIGNLRTGEITILFADEYGAFSVQVNGIQGDTYQLLSEDASGNQSATVKVDDGTIPDDPATVAPCLTRQK